MDRLVGKIIKTDIGNLKILEVVPAGVAKKHLSGGHIEVLEYKVKTECGSEFKTDYFTLKDSLVV